MKKLINKYVKTYNKYVDTKEKDDDLAKELAEYEQLISIHTVLNNGYKLVNGKFIRDK